MDSIHFSSMHFTYGSIAPALNMKSCKIANIETNSNKKFSEDVRFYASIGGNMMHELMGVCIFDEGRLDFDLMDDYKGIDSDNLYCLIRSTNKFGYALYVLTNLKAYYRVFWAINSDETQCSLRYFDGGECVDYKAEIDNLVKAFFNSL